MPVETAPLAHMHAAVEQAVEDAVVFSDALYALHPHECGSSIRDDLAAAYFAISFEHRESIILLARHGAASSAFALARPVYESCVRGLWTKFEADEQQLIRLRRDGVAPSFETVGKQLARSPVVGTLAEVRSDAWAPLSDFAHAGVRQLLNWIGKGEVGPRHPPEQLASLLLVVDIYAYYAMFGMLACAGREGAQANQLYEAFIAPRIDRLKD